MNDIIGMLQALKEDKPDLVITQDIIKEFIEDNIDVLINEIYEEL